MKRFIVLITVLVLPWLLWAQNQTVLKPMTLVKAGRLFDPESGTYASNVEILVREGSVVAVGPNLKYAPDTIIYDLSAYTVMPGLVDAATHLLFEDIIPQQDPRDSLTLNSLRSTTFRAMMATLRAKDMLMAGFTSVRDLGISGDFGDVEVMEALNSARFDGPRMQVSGPSLSPDNGLFRETVVPSMIRNDFRVVHGADDARAAVRERQVRRVSLISVLADNRPNPQKLTFDELSAVVQEARGKYWVAARATLNESAMTAARARVNTIQHGPVALDLFDETVKPDDRTLSDATLREMEKNGVILVPMDYSRRLMRHIFGRQRPNDPNNDLYIERMIQQNGDRLRRAMDAGVKIAMGSGYYMDFSTEGMSRGEGSKQTIYAYVEEGVSPLQALRFATINGAAALGDHRMGVIKPTGYADLIAVDGDPLVDIHALDKVRFVMQNGRVILR